MKRIFLISITTLICFIVEAQETEELPVFPGGTPSLHEFLRKNIVFPQRCKSDSSFSGCKVYVKFMVNEDGSISDPQIVKGCPKFDECDAEVLRVVSIMPKWIPAKRDNVPVKRSYSLPVSFKIN
ncbi:MAG: energy transducer TonB [Bacteroidota bacterium]